MSHMISIMIVSGTRERLQMAAMVASVAAVSGNDVRVFLSMNALPYFRRQAAESAPAEGEVGRLLDEKKAPQFKHLLEQAAELGDAKVYPCSMAMDVLALAAGDLEPFLQEPTGLTQYLDETSEAQVWTF